LKHSRVKEASVTDNRPPKGINPIIAEVGEQGRREQAAEIAAASWPNRDERYPKTATRPANREVCDEEPAPRKGFNPFAWLDETRKEDWGDTLGAKVTFWFMVTVTFIVGLCLLIFAPLALLILLLNPGDRSHLDKGSGYE
jgi:hypothetical protein